MNRKEHIITIDGPAASGKGSISKIISSDLNLYYIETGIYYRIFAKNIKQTNINIENNASIKKHLSSDSFKFDIIIKIIYTMRRSLV